MVDAELTAARGRRESELAAGWAAAQGRVAEAARAAFASYSQTSVAERVALLEAIIAEYKKRGIHSLSHGMLKRMGIAQAFLGQPEVILLDEPTSGLDPQNARQIRDLVRDLQQRRQVLQSILTDLQGLEAEETEALTGEDHEDPPGPS